MISYIVLLVITFFIRLQYYSIIWSGNRPVGFRMWEFILINLMISGLIAGILWIIISLIFQKK